MATSERPVILAVADTASSLPDTFLVRQATPADAEALAVLGRTVGSEAEGWLITDRTWRSTSDERRYLKSLRRYAHAAVFVAEAPEGIVGRLSIARDPHPASSHVADLGLMVAAGRRRQGVGTALMAEATKWALAAGVRKLELHVFPHNEAAIALYEKLGWRREGYRKEHYRRGDGYVDAILMARDLN
ncbi:MAG: GNAT family N-acetyltransferase [Actinobacteria bacterium]|nr:GNAT family N-acetyltransferase [Actinomycetota bacterium]